MAYELQQETFKADAWKRVAETESALQKTKELTRYVQKIIDDQRATDLLFLYTYVDASNYVTPFTATSSIVSPKADRNTYAGTWRLVSNAVDPKLPGYVQTLRLGWAQAIAWDEAFLVGGDRVTEKRRNIVIEFRNFDPAYVEASGAALLAQSPLTDPVIQTKTYTGTWLISKVTPRQEEDGSYTIVANLIFINVITALADLAALTPIKTGLKSVDHPWGDAGGYGSHTSVANNNGLIYSYPNLSGFAVINALTDIQFQSLSEDTAMEFLDKKLTEQDDKTLTLQVAFKRVQCRAWASQTADLTFFHTEVTGKYEKRDRVWLGFQNADEATILAALKSGGAKDDVTDFVVTGVTYTENDDGSKDYTQHLEYARDWPASGVPAYDYEEPVIVADARNGIKYTFLSYKCEAAHAACNRAYTAIEAIGATGNVVNGAVGDRHNGIFDATYTIVTPEDQTSTDYRDSDAASAVVSKHTQNASQVSGSATAGTVRHMSNSPTEVGKFATADEVITPKDQHSHDYADNDAQSATTEKHTQADAELSGSAATGTTRNISNQKTEFGKFATADHVVTPKDQESNSSTDNAAQSSATEHHTQAAAEVTGSAAAGTARQISNRKTEFGKFATDDTVITPKTQTGEAYEKSSDQAALAAASRCGAEDSVKATESQAAAALGAPTVATAGTHVSNSSSPTMFGKYATALTTDTAKYQFWGGTTVTASGTDRWAGGRNATWAQYQAAVATFTFDATCNNSNRFTVNPKYGLIDYSITQAAIDTSLRVWPQSDGTPYTDRWVEYDHLYDKYKGRAARMRRENYQVFTISVRLTWLDAIGVTGFNAYAMRRAPIENHGRGFVIYVPSADIVYGAWEDDELGVPT